MSQKDYILVHLKTKRNITPLEALRLYGCFRLSAVIHVLRQEGMEIRTELVKNEKGNEYARYWLIESKQLEIFS